VRKNQGVEREGVISCSLVGGVRDRSPKAADIKLFPNVIADNGYADKTSMAGNIRTRKDIKCAIVDLSDTFMQEPSEFQEKGDVHGVSEFEFTE
jgi:hypothetical protein